MSLARECLTGMDCSKFLGEPKRLKYCKLFSSGGIVMAIILDSRLFAFTFSLPQDALERKNALMYGS